MRGQELDDARDIDATPLMFLTLDVVDAGDEKQRQISQELQLTGAAFSGKLNYVTGLFWLAENATDDGFQGFGIGQTFQFPQNPPAQTPLVNSSSTTGSA